MAIQDENIDKDQELIMGLAGFDEPPAADSSQNLRQMSRRIRQLRGLDVSGTNASNLSSQSQGSKMSEASFIEPTPDELILRVLKQTLAAYSCTQRLVPEEIVQFLDAQELEHYKVTYIQNMIDNVPYLLYQDYRLDLGNYPINPFVDQEIIFKSQIDELN